MTDYTPTPAFISWFFAILAVSILAGSLLEAARPLQAVTDRQRVHHYLVNFSIWFIGFALVDIVIGDWLLGIPDLVLHTPFGVLYWAGVDITGWWIFAGLLWVDFADYVFHRLMHRLPWLWRIHQVHHSDTGVDVSTTLRMHPLQLLLSNTWLMLALAIAGLPFWLIIAREAVALPVVMLQHSNGRLPWRLECRLATMVAGPAVHRLHHSTEAAEYNSNFGATLVLWDKLLGSFRQPLGHRPAHYGLEASHHARGPGVAAMLVAPFRRSRQARDKPAASGSGR